MGPTAVKRRNVEDEVRRPKKKIRKFKKQKAYHSSSEDDEEEPTQLKVKTLPRQKNEKVRKVTEAQAEEVEQEHAQGIDRSVGENESVLPAAESEDDDSSEDDGTIEQGLDEVQINTALNMAAHDDSEEDEDDQSDEEDDGVKVDGLNDVDMDDDDLDDDLDDEFDSDDPSEVSTATGAARKKRNDPTAFATSISKILTTKLSTQKRSDPILSRSKTADEANKALADGKLDTKARSAIRVEKRALLERGRVRDVLGLETPGVDTGAIVEEEKRLKKTAQRGVVKLFNAVRAAQVKAEEAEQTAREAGLVGLHKREERINEMSKEGFLDLISRGGKAPVEA